MADERSDRTAVVILTRSFRVTGYVALYKGSRLTDFVVEAKLFVPVIDAVVTNHEGREVFRAAFLDIQRDHIELITPADCIKGEFGTW